MFRRITRSAISAFVIAALTLSAVSFAASAAGPILSQTITWVVDEKDEFGNYVQPYYVDEDGNRIEFAQPLRGSAGGRKRAAASLPSSYDARNSDLVTPVKDQGKAQSCWAFATTSVMETSMIKQGYATKNSIDYSEAHLIWFAHRERSGDPTDGAYGDGKYVTNPFSLGGHWLDASATYFRGSGPQLESNAPWQQVSESSMQTAMAQDESTRYDHYARLWSSEVTTDRATVKQWIMEYGGAVANYYHDDTYYRSLKAAYYQDSVTSTNHEVAVVGWDDSYARTNFSILCRPSSNGAWLCKNSWGTNWGKSGYFWISYEDASALRFTKFVAARDDVYDNIYQYDGAWCTRYRYYTDCPVSYEANRFRAKRNEALTHVGVYNPLVGSKITVEIYTAADGYSPNAYANPVAGMTLRSEATAEASGVGNGYLTVALASPVVLSCGRYFTVKVTYDSQSSEPAHLPIEGASGSANEEGVVYYSGNAGESWIGTSGVWKDTGEAGLNNVPIKAMTRALTSDECVNVASGVYVFRNVADPNMVLDIQGDSTSSGANVQLYENLYNQVQKFHVVRSGSSYNIRSVYSGMNLDAASPYTAGSNIRLKDRSLDDSQRWLFEDAGNGNVYIRSICGGYVDAKNGAMTNNTNIQQSTLDGSASQQWQLVATSSYGRLDLPDGVYTIHSAANAAKALNVQGNSTSNGANIELNADRGGVASQQFVITRGSDSGSRNTYYTVRSVRSGCWLDVASPFDQPGCNVRLRNTNTDAAQKWVFEDVGDGSVMIRSLYDTYVGTAGGATADGTNVEMFAYGGAAAMRWTLHKVLALSYDANGGTGAPDPQILQENISLTLSAQQPARVGFTFAGWNTKADGTGASYSAGGTYVGNADVTLFARWTPLVAFTVTFDPNGGMCAETSRAYYPDVALGTLPTAQRLHYALDGWYTQPVGGERITEDTVYTLQSDTTWYAHWVKDPEWNAGDADGDGEICLLDVVCVMRYLAGGWDMQFQYDHADVNGDGVVNLRDAALIKRYLAGWDVELI